MAFTIGREVSVFGNKRVALLSCTVDTASGNVDTGLSSVDGFSVAPVSMATSAIKMVRNVGSGATSLPGKININGAAAGDVFFIVAYGR